MLAWEEGEGRGGERGAAAAQRSKQAHHRQEGKVSEADVEAVGTTTPSVVPVSCDATDTGVHELRRAKRREGGASFCLKKALFCLLLLLKRRESIRERFVAVAQAEQETPSGQRGRHQAKGKTEKTGPSSLENTHPPTHTTTQT